MESKINVYGCRGSLPSPEADRLGFGGHTSSYTLRTPENTVCFLDAGSGLKDAGRVEMFEKETPSQKYLILSHTHADHIEGLPFSPLPYVGKSSVKVVGIQNFHKAVRRYYGGDIFPISFIAKDMPAFDYANLKQVGDMDSFQIDESTRASVMGGLHPRRGLGGSNLYRFDIKQDSDTKTFVFATDNEFDFLAGAIEFDGAEDQKNKYMQFIKGADVLLAEAQYSKEEYFDQKLGPDVRGWGHAYLEQIVEMASEANVANLIITHFDPKHNDFVLDKRELYAQSLAKELSGDMKVQFARQGLEVNL